MSQGNLQVNAIAGRVQAAMIQEVAAAYKPVQQELEGISKPPDIKCIVAKTTELVVGQTIDIPRILVVPRVNPSDCWQGGK